jgi:hypothetical protein
MATSAPTLILRLRNGLRARALFALVMQGINGLIQVSAFFSLQGHAYLDFSAAYLLGTVLSLLLVLNFENTLLAGRWTVSLRRWAGGVWCIGTAGAAWAVAMGSAVPSFIVFCAFGVCFRLFMAWANRARPDPLPLALAGTLVLAACIVGRVSLVMLVAMLAFPLAAWRADGPALSPDDGIGTLLATSARAFARYLPHTVSGLVIGYVDRYVALNLVGGTPAETYLRTVQVVSWASFLAYPVVFHARSGVLREGRISTARAVKLVGQVASAIAVSMVVILAVATHRIPMLAPMVLATVFAAIVCSQCYQVASSLSFVSERFGIINRITLASATAVLLLAFTMVPAWPSAQALALILLTGWSIQITLTLLHLRRHAG